MNTRTHTLLLSAFDGQHKDELLPYIADSTAQQLVERQLTSFPDSPLHMHGGKPLIIYYLSTSQ